MIKKICSILLCFLALVAVSHAATPVGGGGGQRTAPPVLVSVASSTVVAVVPVKPKLEIMATNLQVATSTYAPGSKLTGSVQLKNYSAFPVSNLYYRLNLVGSSTVSLGDNLGPVRLDPGESRIIKWEIILPPIVPSAYAASLEVVSVTGEIFATAYKPVSVKSTSPIQLTEARFILPDHSYSADDQIVVNKQDITFKGVIKNNSKETITFAPQYTLLDGLDFNRLILRYRGATTSLAAGATSSLLLTLPTAKQAAGLYRVSIELPGDQSEYLVTPVIANYVVSGDLALIHNIAVSKTSVKKGEKLTVDIAYSGNKDAKGSVNDVSVEITGSQGQVVGSYIGQWNFSSKLEVQTIEIVALVDAMSPVVNVTVSEGGNQIRTFNSMMMKRQTPTSAKQSLVPLIYLGLGGLIFLMIVIVFYFRKNKLVWILLVIMLSLLVIGYLSYKARAACSVAISLDPNIPTYFASPPGTIYYRGILSYTVCKHGSYEGFSTADLSGPTSAYNGRRQSNHLCKELSTDVCTNGKTYTDTLQFTDPWNLNSPGTYTVGWKVWFCKDRSHGWCVNGWNHVEADETQKDGAFTIYVDNGGGSTPHYYGCSGTSCVYIPSGTGSYDTNACGAGCGGGPGGGGNPGDLYCAKTAGSSLLAEGEETTYEYKLFCTSCGDFTYSRVHYSDGLYDWNNGVSYITNTVYFSQDTTPSHPSLGGSMNGAFGLTNSAGQTTTIYCPAIQRQECTPIWNNVDCRINGCPAGYMYQTQTNCPSKPGSQCVFNPTECSKPCGANCSSNGQCRSGRCDGRCWQDATIQACAVIPPGGDDKPCGQTCTANDQCASGKCDPSTSSLRVCWNRNIEDDSGKTCTTGGNKKCGETCGGNSQCASGACNSGVCWRTTLEQACTSGDGGNDFCIKAVLPGGSALAKKRLSAVEPQKFPLVKDIDLYAYQCSGSQCATCEGVSTLYNTPVVSSLSTLGDWARFLSKCNTTLTAPYNNAADNIPPALTVPNSFITRGLATLSINSRCAPTNLPSRLNSSVDWKFGVHGETGAKVGDGSFKVYFVSSQGKNI